VSDRAIARHRAKQRAVTPLSSLGSAVTGSVGSLGRGGVVIAMSSGLVATMGLPAQGVTASSAKTAPANREAVPAAVPAASLAVDSAFLSSSTALTATAPVSSPATAAMTFDDATFTAAKTPAKPKAAPKPRAHPAAVRTASAKIAHKSRASRSGTRVSIPSHVAGSGVLAIASRYFGVPYRYGGTTPAGFDCSGFTRYVFHQVGVSLPRTANAQMGATRRVSRSSARAGDLVFFVSGGHAYHVGIFAGGNMMYDSPKPGRTVGKHVIWTSAVVFGRP